METKPPPYDFQSMKSRIASVADLMDRDITGFLPPKRRLGEPVTVQVHSSHVLRKIAASAVFQADLFMVQLLRKRREGARG